MRKVIELRCRCEQGDLRDFTDGFEMADNVGEQGAITKNIEQARTRADGAAFDIAHHHGQDFGQCFQAPATSLRPMRPCSSSGDLPFEAAVASSMISSRRSQPVCRSET